DPLRHLERDLVPRLAPFGQIARRGHEGPERLAEPRMLDVEIADLLFHAIGEGRGGDVLSLHPGLVHLAGNAFERAASLGTVVSHAAGDREEDASDRSRPDAPHENEDSY